LTRVHETVKHHAERAASDFNVAVGRYVIMPDHIHLFIRGDDDFVLFKWVGGLKRAISVALTPGGPLWQPGFFDHVLRSEESYGEKWLYVRDNPVRAGLVDDARDWPYQGECVVIDRL
jgi:REP element-mobilizing transposase RayT